MKKNFLKNTLLFSLLSTSLSFADYLAYPKDGYDMVGYAADIIRGRVIVAENDLSVSEESYAGVPTDVIRFMHDIQNASYAVPGPFSANGQEGLLHRVIALDIDNNPETGRVNPWVRSGREYPGGGWEYLVLGDLLFKVNAKNKVRKVKSPAIATTVLTKGVYVDVPRAKIANPYAFSVTWHNIYYDRSTRETLAMDSYGPWFYDDLMEEVKSNPILFDWLVLDGVVDEWYFGYGYSNDADDMTQESDSSDPYGAGHQVDWLNIKLAHTTDTKHLVLAYEMTTPLHLDADIVVFLDTDTNINTGYNGEYYDGVMPIGADYMLMGKKLFYYAGSNGSWRWRRVRKSGSKIRSAINDRTCEIVFPLSLLRSPKSIDLFCAGDNTDCCGSGNPLVDLYHDGATSGTFFRYSVDTNDIGRPYQYLFVSE